MLSSASILSRITRQLSHGAKQALTPAYYGLLEKLGNPHQKLSPVFHVAGTNGKGSTCAFLRAILEAAGYKAHVYTSPHLVRFHERIRIAGQLISEEELVALLSECERLDENKQVSEFEIATAAAFVAFVRHPADFVILETGLGGRFDATNVVDKPLATLITRLSYDHREFLGTTLTQIANEKAGIMRKGVPCFVSAQPEAESINALREAAAKINAPLFIGGEDWRVTPQENSFHFEDQKRKFVLPLPALKGAHQLQNASLAIAALSVLQKPIAAEVVAKGLMAVEWPARLQPLRQGALPQFLAQNQELWLDGGHNDSAGEVLAAQAKNWREEDGSDPRPLYLVYGMLTTKRPQEFLQHLAPYVAAVRTIAIPDEPKTFASDALAAETRACGIENAQSSSSLQHALKELAVLSPQARVLICGSLYLAGYVLRENETRA